ncbi:MAG: IPT/TIG domain-containing protein, partial [Planctomycetota bacterium]
TSAALSWQCGGDLTDGFNVFFGTDMDCVTGATHENGFNEFIDYRTSAGNNPGGMAPSTTYFWRIESVNSMGNTSAGLYWFRTEGPPLLSYNENPGNSSTGVNTTITLTWDNDDPTVFDYGVFFGNSAASVATEDWGNSNETYMGLTGGVTFWNPPLLFENTTYYWRIDPVNGYGNSAGGLWWFVTGSTLTVSISSIEGNSGLCAGLTFVNILGADFDCTCTVEIGGNPAFGVTYQCGNWLTCYTPAGAIGLANVTVTRGGLVNDSLIDGYTYYGFPGGGTGINMTFGDTWASQSDPVFMYDQNDTPVVFFSDNRRIPPGYADMSEIYWGTLDPIIVNFPQNDAFSLGDVPNSEEPQVVTGPLTSLYMTWREYSMGAESVYFNLTNGIAAPWGTAVQIANTSELFGDWAEWAKIAYSPATTEISIFILSGNDDEISQIRRYSSVDNGLNWSYDNVTDDSAIMEDMDVAVNPLGGILVTYSNVTNPLIPNIRFQCKYWDGLTWNGPYRVDNDSTETIKGMPVCTAGSDGTFYAAWLDNRAGNLDVYFSKSMDNGATWTDDKIVDSDSADTWHMDFFRSNGLDRMWIGMSDMRGGSPYSRLWVTNSIDGGNNWSAPVLAADSGGPEITYISGDALDNGSVTFAAESDNDIYVVTSGDNGSTWSAGTRVSTDFDDWYGGPPDDDARLARNTDTNALCALWRTGRPQGTDSPQIRAAISTDNGVFWIGEEVVNDILFLPPEDFEDVQGDAVRVETPTLLANAGAVPAFFAAWADGRNTSGMDWEQTTAIYFNWGNASGWQAYPNICVSDNPGLLFEADPHIAMDNTGNMLCAWTEYDGTTWQNSNPDRIRVARSTDYGQTWGSRVYVDNSSGTGWRRSPRLLWDESRNIWYAVWLDSRFGGGGPDYAIFCAVSTDNGSTWDNQMQISVSISPAWPPVIPAIDPTNDRLYIFWMEGGIMYQFSDDGGQTWNGSDTLVDTSGWPGGAQSFDLKFTPQGVAQIVMEVTDTWPPTEWYVLLQRGLPGAGIWTAPITVVDPLDADETFTKYGGSVVVREDNSEIFIIWPDARNDKPAPLGYKMRTDINVTSGR